MWIASHLAKNRSAQSASFGSVSDSDSSGIEVNASQKYREVPLASPYGIYSVPPYGEQAVVVHTPSADLCLGVVGERPEDLEPGELMLQSDGGASIVLKNDGSVLINGKKFGGT